MKYTDFNDKKEAIEYFEEFNEDVKKHHSSEKDIGQGFIYEKSDYNKKNLLNDNAILGALEFEQLTNHMVKNDTLLEQQNLLGTSKEPINKLHISKLPKIPTHELTNTTFTTEENKTQDSGALTSAYRRTTKTDNQQVQKEIILYNISYGNSENCINNEQNSLRIENLDIQIKSQNNSNLESEIKDIKELENNFCKKS